ncbi:polysaccharide deacetylase family protein [Candidatus Saccharibacteria bacterium]|nr:polysaccharide deacetylase family protein [Candidatus Saccharibacteria bacterium]
MRIIKNLKMLAAAVIVPVTIAMPLQSLAASAPINTGAKVSFTFDDSLASAYTQAAPTLAKYGFTGTNYAISGCVGMTTAPNTCHANNDAVYMSWDQLTALQNTYGWEIGAHTVSHPYLASHDATDGQPKNLTAAQVTAELTNSKSALASHGINATDFASPYGDYNQAVLAQIAKLYASHRGFADTGYNAAPYNNYIIRDQQVQAGVSVATVKGYVDQAIANKQWLVLTFHDIKTNASTNPDDYEYKTADLDAIAAYVKSKSVPVVHVSDGLINGTNLLTNPSFESGLTGWTTDAASNVVLNTANNGSYPNSTNSVAITASTKNVHLFSPKVTVDPNSTYILQSFLNLTKINAGFAMGYFIDEYDANGNWISGQYKQNVNFPWPQTAGFEYKPTSASVANARLQVIAPANSGIVAYVDNFQWINENATTVTPPPAQTNLVANGTFDAGISGGWTTNAPANIVADAANNGSPANPINSVRMTATTANRHLFSPKVTLVSGKTYNVSTYVNIKQLTSGEIGFYMDEYDANGNWISGKYITGARAVGANTVSFNYTPTSTNVKSASLQIILVGNSGIVAYIDNVVWLQN